MNKATFEKATGIKTIANNKQTYGGKAPLVVLKENIIGIPFFFQGNEEIHVSPIQTSPLKGASIDAHLTNHLSDNSLRLATPADCKQFRLATDDYILAKSPTNTINPSPNRCIPRLTNGTQH